MGRTENTRESKWLDRLAASLGGGDPDATADNASLLRFFAGSSDDAVLVCERGRIVFANGSCCRLLGAEDAASLVGLPLTLIHPNHDPDEIERHHAAARRNPLERKAQVQIPGGRPVSVTVREIALGTQDEPVVVAIYRPGEGAARASVPTDAVVRPLAESLFHAVWEWTPATDEIYWSRGIDELMSATDKPFPRLGADLTEAVHPDDRERFVAAHQDCLKSGQPYRYEYRVRGGDGAYRHFVETGSAVVDVDDRSPRLVGAMLDVTDHRRIEKRLNRSTRLESIGQLAGGIAHDFNNLLGGIMGHASYLRELIGPEGPIAESLGTILESTKRAATLTDKLLAFARGETGKRHAVRINRIVEETLSLIATSRLAHVRLVRDLADDPPEFNGEPVQIVQVVMNLIINAADASTRGGIIRVCTGEMELTRKEAVSYGGSRGGRYCFVEIEDNGTGIAPETTRRIYDPFFTTKPPGKGTGLGLAMTQRAVRRHHGLIILDTEPGRGTRFRVGFPAIPPAAPVRREPDNAEQGIGPTA